MKSMWEADYICVLDTGSTDGTYEKLLELQSKYPGKVIVGQKTYKPWRFDVPRNDSMKLIPEDADIYFCTDLDEILESGWYDDIQSN
jgi:glycosyltransferase involved in cell wall biosynthesis